MHIYGSIHGMRLSDLRHHVVGVPLPQRGLNRLPFQPPTIRMILVKS